MLTGYKLNFSKFHAIVILLIFMFFHPAITKAKTYNLRNPVFERTIVLDPGHGGYDTGAKGPDGTFEKSITMEFTLLLAAELKKTYNVSLTRTDDYWVDIPTRTAMANHQHADLFISIHTGGSFLHQASGILLYYDEKIPSSGFMLDAETIEDAKSSNFKELWSNIQVRHQKNSKVLAENILNRLKEKKYEKVESNSKIQGAPLLVLEGADMPAVLIEIGYVTNPGDDKSMNDIVLMSFLAQKIKRGIDDFFEKKP